VSVFGPVKKRYRQKLSTLTGWTDSSPVGKMLFLECYDEARKLAISPDNIKAGWKATGLWPLNIAKPLLNPMALREPMPGHLPAPATRAARTPAGASRKVAKDEADFFVTPRHSS
jgi:4-hydroxybenzoate polyprenyltransferase